MNCNLHSLTYFYSLTLSLRASLCLLLSLVVTPYLIFTRRLFVPSQVSYTPAIDRPLSDAETINQLFESRGLLIQLVIGVQCSP